jgi:hypothetical protein
MPNSIGAPQPAILFVRCTNNDGLNVFVAWPAYLGNDELSVGLEVG